MVVEEAYTFIAGIGVYCPHISKRHPGEARIRYGIIYRARDVLVGQIKPIGFSGIKGRKLFLRQSIRHTGKHSKQAVENLRPNDFLFLLLRQSIVGFIGRLQFLINLLLFLQAHSGQLVRRGELINQLLHVPDGKLHCIRGSGCFRLGSFTQSQVFLLYYAAHRAVHIYIVLPAGLCADTLILIPVLCGFFPRLLDILSRSRAAVL